MKTYIGVILLAFVSTFPSISQSFKLVEVAKGFSKPVDISNTGVADDTRLFIVEKDGRIKIIKDGQVLPTVFLNIDAKVNSTANERGLLGLAFHPQYAQNGYFFVHYNSNDGHTAIARYKVSSADVNKADEASEKIIMKITQPFSNHNGGELVFGPDGYLYIGMGDGGSGGDPGNRSQNPKLLLGKMLRIDINTETEPYKIPSDNPFATSTEYLPEIWSIGLRNPWRFSFDRATGEMWIGDVGQDEWEEISVEPANTGGLNYGWRCYEGKAAFNTSGCQSQDKYLAPVHVYRNSFNLGCSVTGGYVYRGQDFPDMIGKYFYVDYCSGKWWMLSKNNDGSYSNTDLADLQEEDFSSLGEDIDGELYAAGIASGKIYRLTLGTSSTQDTKYANPSISISPNPVTNILAWSFRDQVPNGSSLTAQIINNSGQVVKSWNIDPRNKSFEYDIQDLVAGEYILTMAELPFISTFFVKF